MVPVPDESFRVVGRGERVSIPRLPDGQTARLLRAGAGAVVCVGDGRGEGTGDTSTADIRESPPLIMTSIRQTDAKMMWLE